AHRETGALARDTGLDCLICCGEQARFIYEGFVSSGVSVEARNRAYYFPSREELFGKLPELIKTGDAVLVKASHGEKFDEVMERLRDIFR
ncbi:MAG: UDP-N-acetylmuramoyl-tripeptide--D-alanyl-D-alanine ligase, partial [Oscillospiraceae bacterium]|nr:UDP-N-acetylmuramoyl-tripeptide--D-alanyl-D-alanine ligase [Oscillospiraceae bacterium]